MRDLGCEGSIGSIFERLSCWLFRVCWRFPANSGPERGDRPVVGRKGKIKYTGAVDNDSTQEFVDLGAS